MQSTWRNGTGIASRSVRSRSRHQSVRRCKPLNVPSAQVNPELKSHFEDKGFRFVGQDTEGERMEVIELDGTERDVNQSSDNHDLSAHLSTLLFRAPVLRGRAVSPRVHLSPHQAVASLPRPAAGFRREAAELPAEGLPAVSTVTPPQRPARCRFEQLFRAMFYSSRDTYSDRSGSSTPDSEISELKLPSISSE